MNRCPTCAAAVPAASRFCNSCGVSIEDAATLTIAPARPPSSSQHSSEEGRFPASAILGERYRILGLLGRGGMGEVYRAFDLKLDQTVALKFLPAATARDPRLLERFRGEVRIARQVSHRNVCRVLFSVWILLRFGVLAFVVATFIQGLLGQLPFTLDLSAWYSGGTIVTLITVVVLAVWSFRVALGGRQIWKEDFLDR